MVSENLLLVRLIGIVDVASLRELDSVVSKAERAKLRFAVVDLSEVALFTAVGLNFLSRLITACETVQLVGLDGQPEIRRMLAAVGLEPHLIIH
ncbi:STAS domain-containing protein [Cryptosporangium sp. NPDC048952]|uniref:STAS domain-containing protein n=1 Tax=Cryptosporangium sp. NPDC048952 TaxID=3363961 RepID=UPI003723A832